VRITVAIAGLVLVAGFFNASGEISHLPFIDGPETLELKTASGQSLEANVSLDGKSIGYSESGSLEVTEKQLKNSEKVRLRGTYDGLAFDRSYPASRIDFSGEKPVLRAKADDVGTHELAFDLEGSNTDLEGTVYNDGKAVGRLSNGSVRVSPRDLEYGDIVLEADYNSSKYNISFPYGSGSRNSSKLGFVIDQDTMRAAAFDVGDLDEAEIETKVLRYINDFRNGETVPAPSSSPEQETEYVEPVDRSGESVGSGFTPFTQTDYLEMDNRLRADAREKSQEISDQQYFSHESPSGEGHQQRLKNREIFYVGAGENLHKTASIPYYWSETDVARAVVGGWSDSPGHRSLMVDRDRIYTDAGIGLECNRSVCYATFVAAKTSTVLNNRLEKGYCTYKWINNPGWGLEYTTDVDVSFRTNGEVDAYFVDDGKAQFDRCVEGKDVDGFESFEATEGFEHSYSDADQGDAVVISSRKASNISLKIDYTK